MIDEKGIKLFRNQQRPLQHEVIFIAIINKC